MVEVPLHSIATSPENSIATSLEKLTGDLKLLREAFEKFAARQPQPAPGERPRFNWPQFTAAVTALRQIAGAGTLEDAHELADEALEAIEDAGQPAPGDMLFEAFELIANAAPFEPNSAEQWERRKREWVTAWHAYRDEQAQPAEVPARPTTDGRMAILLADDIRHEQPAPELADDVHVDWHMTPQEWGALAFVLGQHADTPYIARLIEAGKVPAPTGEPQPAPGCPVWALCDLAAYLNLAEAVEDAHELADEALEAIEDAGQPAPGCPDPSQHRDVYGQPLGRVRGVGEGAAG